MLFMINNVSCSFCLCESCVHDLFCESCIEKIIINFLFLFIQLKQTAKNDLHEIFLSKLMHFFLLSCMIFMFFVCIFLIWSEVQIMQISYFISCCQLSQQNMSLLHFQQLWVVTVAFICQLNCFLKVVTDWHEILNELSF